MARTSSPSRRHNQDGDRRNRSQCRLVPINLHNPDEFDELLRQRVLCGWSNTPGDVEAWRDEVDAKTKAMYWISPCATDDGSPQGTDDDAAAPGVATTGDSRTATNTTTTVRAGHISLVSATHPPDPELTQPDGSVLMLSALFVLPAFRGRGLARAAVEEMERRAKARGCRTMTLHTTSRRYAEDDGDDWRGLYARRGLPTPQKGSSNEDWYARMGYVKWKEEPRYPDRLLDGTEVRLVAAFLRKDL